MALIGDILYPEDERMAGELNAEQHDLAQAKVFYTTLVNAYRSLGADVRRLDAYLTGIVCLHYSLVYAPGALATLPRAALPRVTIAALDRVQELDELRDLSDMVSHGLHAVGHRVADLVHESGAYKHAAATSDWEAFQAEMELELDAVASCSRLALSGNVELLTTDDAGELEGVMEELEGLAGGARLVAAESEIVGDGIAAAKEAGAAQSELAAEEGLAGSVLGPAVALLAGISEVIGLLAASARKVELERAVASMRHYRTLSDKNLASLKRAFKALLGTASAEIDAYNRILARTHELLPTTAAFDGRRFSTTELERFRDELDAVTVGQLERVSSGRERCATELQAVITFLQGHAQNNARMALVIGMIKGHPRQENRADGELAREVHAVTGIPLRQVELYDELRKYLASCAARLRPYHQELRAGTAASARARANAGARLGEPDPDFEPDPVDFIIPSTR